MKATPLPVIPSRTGGLGQQDLRIKAARSNVGQSKESAGWLVGLAGSQRERRGGQPRLSSRFSLPRSHPRPEKSITSGEGGNRKALRSPSLPFWGETPLRYAPSGASRRARLPSAHHPGNRSRSDAGQTHHPSNANRLCFNLERRLPQAYSPPWLDG